MAELAQLVIVHGCGEDGHATAVLREDSHATAVLLSRGRLGRPGPSPTRRRGPAAPPAAVPIVPRRWPAITGAS